MPIWTADLVWLRLVKAATAHPRSSGDAEVLAWPSLHIGDGDLRDVVFSALYARVHGNRLEMVARQRHGVSLKTFQRRRRVGCAEIAKGVNALKWSALALREPCLCL